MNVAQCFQHWSCGEASDDRDAGWRQDGCPRAVVFPSAGARVLEALGHVWPGASSTGAPAKRATTETQKDVLVAVFEVELFSSVLARVLEALGHGGYRRRMLQSFDPKQPFRVRRGDLPHWWQPGCSTFVTLRLHDAIPAAVNERLRRRRYRHLRELTGSPPRTPEADMFALLSDEDREVVKREFSRRIEATLDHGHGECVLRRPEAAAEVAKALHHFDGERYELADFVVMPNHVHLLAAPIAEHELEAICYSWKQRSAKEINRLLGRRGEFWQPEAFDHLVRSTDHFEKYQRYIRNNPRKARLCSGEYLIGCGRALDYPLP